MSKRILLLLFVLANFRSYGQENLLAFNDTGKDTTDYFSLSLEELLKISVVSASKQEERLAEAPMSIYRISKEELNRWGVRSLYETVQRVPGFSFYNTDYYGQYGVISRGFQSIWRFGYSVELMPIVDFGHMNFVAPYFKSVEVARGPGGLAWGSNANAGLINVNLRDDLEGVEVVGSYGNQNYYDVTVMAGNKFNNDGDGFFVGYNVKGMRPEDQMNAFGIPGSVYRMNGLNPSQNLTGKLKYKWFKSMVMYDQGDHVAPYLWFGEPYEFDTESQTWNKTKIGTLFEDIYAKTGKLPHDQLTSLAYRNEFHLPLKQDNLDVFLYNNYFKRSWFFDPIATLGDSRRDFGFGLNYTSIDSKFNLNVGGDIWGRSRLGMHHYTSHFARDYGIDWFDNNLDSKDIDYSNVFVQANYRFLDKFKAIVGGRVDYQKRSEDEFVYTGPRLGLVYSPNDRLTVKYLYNRAPRRPQSNELAGNTPKPELLSAHELSAFYNFSSKFTANVTIFDQQLKDQITRVNNGSLNAFMNTGGLKSKGVEWALNYMPSRSWLIYYNGSVFDSKVIKGYVKNADGSVTEVAEKHNSRNQPLFVPFYTGFLGTEYNVGGIVKLNAAVRSIHKIPYIEADNVTESYKSTNFYDLTITSKKFWNKAEFSLVGMNIFDNRKGLPAYGEHAGNRNGTIAPEGARFFFRTRFDIK